MVGEVKCIYLIYHYLKIIKNNIYIMYNEDYIYIKKQKKR